MSEFRHSNSDISQGMRPRSYDPITPVPPTSSHEQIIKPCLSGLNPVKRTPQQQVELYKKVSQESGPYPTSDFASTNINTTATPAVGSAANPTTEPIKRIPHYMTYTFNNDTYPAIEMVVCALMRYMREFKITPDHVYASSDHSYDIREGVKNMYGEIFPDSIPILNCQQTLQHVVIDFREDIPKDTITCISQRSS
jgi:hypothetical protein